MFTEVGSVGASRVASLEAENVTTHEVVPLDDLLVAVVVAIRPSGGIEKATEGVTAEVGTVGIELSSKVVGSEVDEGLIDETNDLDVVGGPHELDTLKSSGRDETGSMAGLGAPCDFLLFGFPDGGGTIGGRPEAEV